MPSKKQLKCCRERPGCGDCVLLELRNNPPAQGKGQRKGKPVR